MGKLLAIDWSSNYVRILLANSQPGQITLEHVQSLQVELPADPKAEAPAAVRERITDALREPRYRNAEVLLAVRRADVELRLLSLPPVPVEELPDIVRLQALREFSEVSDDWPLDYLPQHGGEQDASALAAVIAPRKLANYERILHDADLKPRACVLRPTATALLVSQLDDSLRPDVELCIDDLDTEYEMSVLREGVPVLIRTIQAPRAAEQDQVALLDREIRRTMVAASNQLQGHSVQRIVMFGVANDGTADLAIALQARVKLPVRVLDPFSAAGLRTTADALNVPHPRQLAASVGLLVSRTLPNPALIDFTNPRRVIPPKSHRSTWLAVATAAMVLVAAAFGYVYWQLAELDNEAARLQARIQSQKKLVEEAQQRINEVAAIQAWEKSDVNWLLELQELSAKIPGPERARLLRWQADIVSNGDGQVTLEGVVDAQATIGLIDESLRTEKRGVQNAGGELDNQDRDYPWHFKHTLTIANQVPPVNPVGVRNRRSAR